MRTKSTQPVSKAKARSARRVITAIVHGAQAPLLQWHEGEWHLWLSYNFDRDCGTFLRLAANGSITRETEAEDGSIKNVTMIKEAET